jgi:hypothetical protein
VKNPGYWIKEIQEMTRKPVTAAEWYSLVRRIQDGSFRAGVDAERKRIREGAEALPAGDSMGIFKGIRTFLIAGVAGESKPYPPMEYDSEL